MATGDGIRLKYFEYLLTFLFLCIRFFHCLHDMAALDVNGKVNIRVSFARYGITGCEWLSKMHIFGLGIS